MSNKTHYRMYIEFPGKGDFHIRQCYMRPYIDDEKTALAYKSIVEETLQLILHPDVRQMFRVVVVKVN